MPEEQNGQGPSEARAGRSSSKVATTKPTEERRVAQRRVANLDIEPETEKRVSKRRTADKAPKPSAKRAKSVSVAAPLVERRVTNKSLIERRLVDPSAKERRKANADSAKRAAAEGAAKEQLAAESIADPAGERRPAQGSHRATGVEAELRAHEHQNWLHETALWARKGGAVVIGLDVLTVLAVLVLWHVHSSQLSEMSEMRRATLNEVRRATAASGEAAYAACLGNQSMRSMLQQMKSGAGERRVAANIEATQAAVAHPDAAQVVFDVEKSTTVTENVPVLFHFGVENVGKSAALNAKVWGAVRVVDTGKEPDFRYDEATLDKQAISPSSPAAKLVVYESKDGMVAPLSNADYQRVNSGSAYVVAYGRAYYRDVYGARHWVEFCHTIAAPNGTQGHSSRCPAYNGAGVSDVMEKSPAGQNLATVDLPEVPCELPKEEKN